MSIFDKNEDNKNINFSLNFLKCVAIFAVICIHCGSFPIVGNKGLVIDAVSRFAVPVFFLISGFYSYYKGNSIVLGKYKRRIVKLIKY